MEQIDPGLLKAPAPIGISDDPLWYKDAIIYELHVKAFADSNNDGVGDFNGATETLCRYQMSR